MINKKKHLILFSALLFFAAPSQASTCMLEKAFVFGASLSAGYGKMSDALWGKGTGSTPLQVMIENSGKDFSYNSENTKITGGWYFEDTVDMLNSYEVTEQMKQSSAIISVDAFYWDSIDGEAETAANNTCEATIRTLNTLVEFADFYDVPLVLSNIPAEKGTPVTRVVRTMSGWREPFDNCYVDFNEHLEQICLTENDCFIVDINSVVEKLNSGQGVLWNGKMQTQTTLRLDDGVHLTDFGNAYIAHLIETSVLTTNPDLLSCDD